jgi:hypothetical protein
MKGCKQKLWKGKLKAAYSRLSSDVESEERATEIGSRSKKTEEGQKKNQYAPENVCVQYKAAGLAPLTDGNLRAQAVDPDNSDIAPLDITGWETI